MPKPESLLWQQHVSKLKNFGMCKRIEDSTQAGVSDVVYCLRWLDERPVSGWCELKRLKDWPKRSTTKILLPHFTIDQANFLRDWGRAGMGSYLLAQVGVTFLVWRWHHAHAIQAGLMRNQFKGLAEVCEDGKFPTAKVLRCLTK